MLCRHLIKEVSTDPTRGDDPMQAEHVVHNLLTATCRTMHQTRRTSRKVTVLAALSGTRLTVTDLGRSIRSPAKQKYCIQSADRVLSSAHLHRARLSIYSALRNSKAKAIHRRYHLARPVWTHSRPASLWPWPAKPQPSKIWPVATQWAKPCCVESAIVASACARVAAPSPRI